ncbi:MAG TPA: CopD family protein [bacterium]
MNGWRHVGIVVFLSGLLVTGATPAFAHAVLERSDPPPNAALREPPTRITLRFTEPIDAALSSVTVVDGDGKRVSGRAMVSADGRGARVPLSRLVDGVYAVKWRALSTLDGHASSGVFLFAVGLGLQLTTGGPATAPPDPITIAVRWLALAAAIVLTGSVVFRAVVLYPARAGPHSDSPQLQPADIALRRSVQIAGAVLLVGIIFQLLLRGMEILDAPFQRLFSGGTVWTLLIGTKLGWSVLLQTSLVCLLLVTPSARGRLIQAVGLVLVAGVVLLVAVFGGPAALATSTHALHLLLVVLAAALYGLLGLARRPWHAHWIPVLIAVGLLGGFTISSHAVGLGLPAIAADWLHVVATAVWIGGLVSLLLALGSTHRSDRPAVGRTLVSRFSMMAGVALAALILTGTYSAWTEVPALRAFAETPYGRTLLVKLVIVAPLVALGALNRIVLSPMLKSREADAAPLVATFLRFVGGEVFLGATVLVVVAVLTIIPPARVTLPGPATAEGPHFVGFAGEIRVSLTVTPGQPGWNRFEIDLIRGTQAEEAQPRIFLRLTKLDEQLDPVILRPSRQTGEQYVVEAGEMALPGWWDLEVIVRRAGVADTSAEFPIRLGKSRTALGPNDPLAERLVERARRTAMALRAWREVLHLTDGKGGGTLTWFAVKAPDRMQYRAQEGTEAIVIGRVRYFRAAPGPWERDLIAEPFAAQGPLVYLKEMRATSLGRRMPCGDEVCQVVLWEWDRTTGFAAMIGTGSHRVHEIVMAAPAHYMTLHYEDFNAPIHVVPPR